VLAALAGVVHERQGVLPFDSANVSQAPTNRGAAGVACGVLTPSAARGPLLSFRPLSYKLKPGEPLTMTNSESERADKAGSLKARIRDVVASGGPGIVIFAIIVAAQIIVVPGLVVALWLIKTLWR
jgi:hypothetical protein